jgi:choline dehydrogenase-like flavoprotein
MLNAFGVGVCKGVLAEGTVLPACKVVDASLFPVVPCANTNFPTLMTAGRIADATLAAA